MDSNKILISPKSIIIALSFIFLGWLIYQTRDVILLLFASFIIASALFPVVDWLSKKMPRGIAVSLVYLVGFIILATVLIPFFVITVQQIQEFLRETPAYWAAAENLILDWQLSGIGGTIIPDFSQIITSVSNLGQDIVSQSINFTITIFTGIVAIFTLAIIVLFLLLDKQELKNGFLKLFPENTRDRAASITVTISKKVGGYVRGQLLIMLAVGILTALGLFIIGVDFALLLGLLAALFEIVPIVGPILAAVPAVLVALAQDPMLALWAIVVYLVVQRIENSILAPLILGKFLEMHPLIILIALLVAASTLGVVGVILSPAIAAAIYVLVQELYLKKINPENGQ